MLLDSGQTDLSSDPSDAVRAILLTFFMKWEYLLSQGSPEQGV